MSEANFFIAIPCITKEAAEKIRQDVEKKTGYDCVVWERVEL